MSYLLQKKPRKQRNEFSKGQIQRVSGARLPLFPRVVMWSQVFLP